MIRYLVKDYKCSSGDGRVSCFDWPCGHSGSTFNENYGEAGLEQQTL